MLTILCYRLAIDIFGGTPRKECGRWERDLGIHDGQVCGSGKWRYLDLLYFKAHVRSECLIRQA